MLEFASTFFMAGGKMLHHIIVKFNDDLNVEQKREIVSQARELFSGLTQLSGIHNVELHSSCIDRPNRYDLMIVISMDQGALPLYDDCEIHHRWKDNFSKFIKSKAIFDYQ